MHTLRACLKHGGTWCKCWAGGCFPHGLGLTSNYISGVEICWGSVISRTHPHLHPCAAKHLTWCFAGLAQRKRYWASIASYRKKGSLFLLTKKWGCQMKSLFVYFHMPRGVDSLKSRELSKCSVSHSLISNDLGFQPGDLSFC